MWDVLQRVGAGAVDAQLQMQVVAAVGTAHIPGVAHIADHIALMHRLPRADAKAGHVRIQGGIAAMPSGITQCSSSKTK